jgi:hypothetical protein
MRTGRETYYDPSDPAAGVLALRPQRIDENTREAIARARSQEKETRLMSAQQRQQRIHELQAFLGELDAEKGAEPNTLALGARTTSATLGVGLTAAEESMIRSHGMSPLSALKAKVNNALNDLRRQGL